MAGNTTHTVQPMTPIYCLHGLSFSIIHVMAGNTTLTDPPMTPIYCLHGLSFSIIHVMVGNTTLTVQPVTPIYCLHGPLFIFKYITHKWPTSRDFAIYIICVQRRLKRACTIVQSRQKLPYCHPRKSKFIPLVPLDNYTCLFK